MLSGRLSANTYILNGLCLIYLSTMLCDSRLLSILIRSVVSREDEKLLTSCRRHKGPAITNIGDIACGFYKHDNDCT